MTYLMNLLYHTNLMCIALFSVQDLLMMLTSVLMFAYYAGIMLNTFPSPLCQNHTSTIGPTLILKHYDDWRYALVNLINQLITLNAIITPSEDMILDILKYPDVYVLL